MLNENAVYTKFRTPSTQGEGILIGNIGRPVQTVEIIGANLPINTAFLEEIRQGFGLGYLNTKAHC